MVLFSAVRTSFRVVLFDGSSAGSTSRVCFISTGSVLLQIFILVGLGTSLSISTSTRTTPTTSITEIDTGWSRTAYDTGVLTFLSVSTVFARFEKGLESSTIIIRFRLAFNMVPVIFCLRAGLGTGLPIRFAGSRISSIK